MELITASEAFLLIFSVNNIHNLFIAINQFNTMIKIYIWRIINKFIYNIEKQSISKGKIGEFIKKCEQLYHWFSVILDKIRCANKMYSVLLQYLKTSLLINNINWFIKKFPKQLKSEEQIWFHSNKACAGDLF